MIAELPCRHSPCGTGIALCAPGEALVVTALGVVRDACGADWVRRTRAPGVLTTAVVLTER